ncbi:MAG: metal-sensitive transcriptional regulator [Bacteroidota bacterium]
MTAPVSEDQALLLKRLRRIEGQVRGIQRMVEDDRYCGDILNQIAAIRQALTSTARVVMRRHLETCVTDALRSGDAARAEATYDELMDLLSKKLGV